MRGNIIPHAGVWTALGRGAQTRGVRLIRVIKYPASAALDFPLNFQKNVKKTLGD